MRAVKPLYLKAILLTFGSALWLMLSACGSATAPENALTISIELPEGETDDFWLGVEKRTLTFEKEGERREIAYAPGSSADLPCDEGEKITFSGFTAEGILIVAGQAVVGPQKRVSIPVKLVDTY
ncbi:MAG: hypothetical protein EOP11_16655 [Proteobacteria bacterium]|nr:MAG: hypothetical protein EOP11_16655 [Pseudomonadota bacterium]